MCVVFFPLQLNWVGAEGEVGGGGGGEGEAEGDRGARNQFVLTTNCYLTVPCTSNFNDMLFACLSLAFHMFLNEPYLLLCA